MSLISELFEKTEEERKFILKGLSLKEKLELEKSLALNDCIYFGEKYIKPYDKKWVSETAEFHYELIDAILKYERLQVRIIITSSTSPFFQFFQSIKKKNISQFSQSIKKGSSI